MSIVTIRISDNLLNELNKCTKEAHMPRAEYIRQAIEQMNKTVLHHAQQKRLKEASLKVRAHSMEINAEFGEAEYDDLDA